MSGWDAIQPLHLHQQMFASVMISEIISPLLHLIWNSSVWRIGAFCVQCFNENVTTHYYQLSISKLHTFELPVFLKVLACMCFVSTSSLPHLFANYLSVVSFYLQMLSMDWRYKTNLTYNISWKHSLTNWIFSFSFLFCFWTYSSCVHIVFFWNSMSDWLFNTSQFKILCQAKIGRQGPQTVPWLGCSLPLHAPGWQSPLYQSLASGKLSGQHQMPVDNTSN